MKKSIEILSHKISRPMPIFGSDEDVIRAEIFSATRLETHGESLAIAQAVTDHPELGKKLGPRLIENRRALETAYKEILKAVKEQRAITPAAEWLIDNFHIVRAQLQDIRDNLPPKYYSELPKLKHDPFSGLPRVYGIAWAFVAHNDSLFDPELLTRFVKAYQREQPLTIGELWAISITLKIVLIENLRRISDRIVISQVGRKAADQIADEILGLGEKTSRPVVKIIDYLNSQKFGVAFYVQLLQRLHFQDTKVNPILEWIDFKLTQEHLHADTVVSIEHNSQTAANATVRNIITSFRIMANYDWQVFFENVSLVERSFRQNATYAEMDFATRDRYRHALEKISRSTHLPQLEIAQKLIEVSKLKKVDPGFLLLDEGREEFESEVGARLSLGETLRRRYLKHGTDLFLGGMIFVTIGIFSIINYVTRLESPGLFLYLFAVIPAVEVAVGVVNRLTVALLGPQHLPRLNLEKGIPQNYRTFIVMPTMISKKNDIETQLEQLEIHFLANPDGFVHFALLTDFRDSLTETNQEDANLLQQMKMKVEALNQKYPKLIDGTERFYIYHRKRLYNSSEGKWMGWERKRGKLSEFNRLLLGHHNTSHLSLDGSPVNAPLGVRYVITLDSDTKLPKGSVSSLVGTMAHPLNHPEFENGKVVKGYGILQPRITTLLPAAHEVTLYQRLTSGPWGVDPYAVKVSDVYQDLFGEASYLGKGIYDVEVYEKSLENRIPENSLLSHDLFESQFARCGYLSDIEFFEDAVSHVGVAAARNHRWIRGDWQLLPWIGGREGKLISIIGRWKMLDNLRRSLLAPSLFLLVSASLISVNPRPWLCLVLFSIATPALLSAVIDLLKPRANRTFKQKFAQIVDDFWDNLQRIFMFIIFIPYDSWMCLDAIFRSLYRQFVSHKYLLEWTTAAQVKESASLELKSFFKAHLGSQILNVIFVSVIFASKSEYTLQASYFFILWFCAPMFAHYISNPRAPAVEKPIDQRDRDYLEMRARRIWHFFNCLVTERDHFLPPDNFQETPEPVVAHRSSPTNFGLYLLSILSAHDFGWLTKSNTVDKILLSLKTLEKLETYNGHFFNWYETTDLRPLEPRYISAVDNGNLAGHLLAVAQGLNDLLLAPFSFENFLSGLKTSFELFKTELPLDKIATFSELELLISRAPKEEIFRSGFWRKVQTQVARVEVSLAEAKNSESWTLFKAEIDQWIGEFENLFSWVELATTPPAGTSPKLNETLKELRPTKNASLTAFERKIEIALRDLQKLESIEANAFLSELILQLSTSLAHFRSVDKRIRNARSLCYKIFEQMDFNSLYDPVRKLFSIGMRVHDETLDASFYDLLASEARLLSFIAIAKGDVPVKHWFHLGRGLVPIEGGAALVSWSGSMFEYLMPPLVMLQPKGSLLDQCCQLIVQKQIDYGGEKSIPWGISESAYNQRDLHLTYQYTNFGVPTLALKRGLGADRVVAPYATFLAAMYDTPSACANLRRLGEMGAQGRFGFYEAVDFTPSRLPDGQDKSIVKAYMAHHQGMSLLAITNILKTSLVARRFHREPMVQATELLLQERIPKNVGAIESPAEEHAGQVRSATVHVSRHYHSVQRSVPTTQLLSNGNYSVMLTSAGSGFSRSGPIAVTRWREDVTKDNWGTYFFLKDCTDNKIWSAAYQPTCVEGEHYEVSFAEDRAKFSQVYNNIASQMEIFISAESKAEVRRLTLTNQGFETREIEITSYCEIVLNTQAADQAHPAFSNLFVQTEYLDDISALLATRRKRSPTDRSIWAAHVVAVDKHSVSQPQYETSRLHFLGRNQDIRTPDAIFKNAKLTNSAGSVLDPIFSLRTKIKLPPGTTSHVTFSTITGETREEVLIQAENFHDFQAEERASHLAWTQAQVKLHYLNIEAEEAHLFQRIATRLLYLDSSLRPSGEVIRRNQKDVTGLWAHGISGDFPIIVVRIDDIEGRTMIRQLLKCQEYLASKAFTADLVILNDKGHSYIQELQNTLLEMAPSAPPPGSARGKVFVLRSDLMSVEDRLQILSEARVILNARLGSLADQVKREIHRPQPLPIRALDRHEESSLLPAPELDFFNGYGGFSQDGKEYVTVITDKDQQTPAPWINVIANSKFGFQVSTSGAGFTWADNSRENQITPWSNDPVTDPLGEAFYIYDSDSECLWSPTSRPIQLESASYITRHGQGYSIFEHLSHGIQSELTQFVLLDRPVKISRLKLKNKSVRRRSLSIYSYVEWLLGFSRPTMAPYTITEIDQRTGAMFAMNPRNPESSHKISFAGFIGGQSSLTGDRSEFIGRNGTLAKPAAIERSTQLSGVTGATLDPCGAFQKDIEMSPGEEVEIVFVLGQADSREHAKQLIVDVQKEKIETQLKEVTDEWDEILTTVQIETPEKSMDLLVNRWLLYQTLVCRYYARSAFYQAGGAYGFRDQLQDMMAMMLSKPQLAREQILRAASRQFLEGDVQHWWHPSGKGVRTHFSDDLLWLPYVVSHYIKVTGDVKILEEQILFIEAPLLREDQEDAYITPMVSPQSQSLFEHCARAIDRSLRVGSHGLPLMGAGDWNDGMNRVGQHGKGESVWVAWFLSVVLRESIEWLKTRGDTSERMTKWSAHLTHLKDAVEKEAWDGDWYRRAFYDDGTPMGSVSSEECKIDSLSQTWAVISQLADPARAAHAMQALNQYLVKTEDELVLLFTPPFDKTANDPGYIKGYLPGVRENGGQYTHAAAWCVIAFAMMNDGAQALKLFNLLNPIRHSLNEKSAEKYKIEPYVIAADVYSQPPHTGRGGWSWYTGSSSWFYRSAVEYILGLRVSNDELTISPSISPRWNSYKIKYRYKKTTYEILVENQTRQNGLHVRVNLDGQDRTFPIKLVDDQKHHLVKVTL